jgi:hypothetical protein
MANRSGKCPKCGEMFAYDSDQAEWKMHAARASQGVLLRGAVRLHWGNRRPPRAVRMIRHSPSSFSLMPVLILFMLAVSASPAAMQKTPREG